MFHQQKHFSTKWSFGYQQLVFILCQIVCLFCISSLEVCTGRFFRPGPGRPELISFLPTRPGPLEKSLFICRPCPVRQKNYLAIACPVRWKNRLSLEIALHLPAWPGPARLKNHEPGTGLASDLGQCKNLPRHFVRSSSWKVKTTIPLFIANTFLHISMTHVNFILFSSMQTY